MRALTLTQPWATLVALGAKTIETRCWSSSYRGPVMIHAAKGFPADARAIVPTAPFIDALGGAGLPTGVVVAVADMRNCLRFGFDTADWLDKLVADGKLPPHEAAFGDFAPGRYGFCLRNVVALPVPVPARGMLNFWKPDADTVRQVSLQLATAAAI